MRAPRSPRGGETQNASVVWNNRKCVRWKSWICRCELFHMSPVRYAVLKTCGVLLDASQQLRKPWCLNINPNNHHWPSSPPSRVLFTLMFDEASDWLLEWISQNYTAKRWFPNKNIKFQFPQVDGFQSKVQGPKGIPKNGSTGTEQNWGSVIYLLILLKVHL